jgi:hypothetical protein
VQCRGGANTQFGVVRYSRLRAAVTWALSFATLEIDMPYPDIDKYEALNCLPSTAFVAGLWRWTTAYQKFKV